MALHVPYLTLNDYLPMIQDDQLNEQVLDELQAGDRERLFSENWAMSKFRGKLSQEYDLDYEFTETLPFSMTKEYYAGQRCTIDFEAWVSETLYPQDSLVVREGVGYICLLENNDAEFDDAKWQGMGKQYTIYYIPLPYPLFSQSIQISKGTYTAGFYSVGDKVFWNNKIYSCLKDTVILDNETLLQYGTYSSVPASNVFPNAKNGTTYWKFEEDYIVEAGDYPTNTPSVWVIGDNRDPLFVKGVIDLALWMLHSRISPMHIPKLRIDNKDFTFVWLSDVRKGDDTVDVQSIQPNQGERIRWGSNIKVQNGYG